MDLIADHVLRRIMKILFWVAIGIAIGMFWAYQQQAYAKCMALTQPAGWVASAKVKAAMQYHGIRFAECSPDGNLFFIRDGDACNLFTKGFLKSWEAQCGEARDEEKG